MIPAIRLSTTTPTETPTRRKTDTDEGEKRKKRMPLPPVTPPKKSPLKRETGEPCPGTGCPGSL